MDSRQFDYWARTIAKRRPRRDIVRGLASGVSAWLATRAGGASAQEGTVPLGGACTTDSECALDMMGSAICADNGIAEDGLLNCCRESGCCGVDADCCGDKLCAPSGEVCNHCATPPFPTQYPGQECTEDAQCVASVVRSVICGSNGIDSDGPLNCCYEHGSFCSRDELCCGSLFCLDNYCQRI
jgi:hypothetical protein